MKVGEGLPGISVSSLQVFFFFVTINIFELIETYFEINLRLEYDL